MNSRLRSGLCPVPMRARGTSRLRSCVGDVHLVRRLTELDNLYLFLLFNYYEQNFTCPPLVGFVCGVYEAAWDQSFEELPLGIFIQLGNLVRRLTRSDNP